MKRADNKSDCPINFTTEIFGDSWSLLIVRDMMTVGKKTFGEFLASDERIGPSVLAERLVHLEQKGIITKQPDKTDKRKIIYSLTSLGLQTMPLVYEIAKWGSDACASPKEENPWYASTLHDQDLVLKLWREAIQAGSSFFIGPDSVAHKLDLL